jgi:hypothetical protein
MPESLDKAPAQTSFSFGNKPSINREKYFPIITDLHALRLKFLLYTINLNIQYPDVRAALPVTGEGYVSSIRRPGNYIFTGA